MKFCPLIDHSYNEGQNSFLSNQIQLLNILCSHLLQRVIEFIGNLLKSVS